MISFTIRKTLVKETITAKKILTLVDMLTTHDVIVLMSPHTEVLLDMKATGGELGWLTWPFEQGDKPGVSIALAHTRFTHLEFARTETLHRKGQASVCVKYLTI